MRNSERDEFYIGYAPIPRRVARTVLRTVLGLVALTIAVAGILVFAQQPFARSTFEFQQYREFSGVLASNPYPALLVGQPGAKEYSRYWLVAPGKHGADSLVAGFVGKPVSLRGSLIYRDGQTMVEVVPGSLQQQPGSAANPEETDLGEVVLRGEIVDTKCYLGVMNPGRTKVHRDCAVRCISGGAPPALVTGDGFYLLVGGDGRALRREVLDWVAETIEVTGDLRRSGETLILRTEPSTFRRVDQ
jgi:hypothetical protein